jgi:hypothetical protein
MEIHKMEKYYYSRKKNLAGFMKDNYFLNWFIINGSKNHQNKKYNRPSQLKIKELLFYQDILVGILVLSFC